MLFFFYLITLLISAINTQLTFLSPHSLSSLFINNTIDIEYGKVGPLTDFYIRGQIILENITPNKDACSSLTGINLRKNNNTAFDENFKILLAFAGSCPISQKARNAQNAGAFRMKRQQRFVSREKNVGARAFRRPCGFQ